LGRNPAAENQPGHGRCAMKFRTKTILGIALIEGILLTILVFSVLGQLQSSN
jgi:hypothetical protein